jgi:hypothetical protein
MVENYRDVMLSKSEASVFSETTEKQFFGSASE